MLLDEHEKRVIQVVDAKNLRRGLLITTQLAEMGLPVVLTLNMWDELLDRSMNIDVPVLQETLNIPIIKTIATHRVGINALLGSIESARAPSLHIDYGSVIEEGILKIQKILNGDTVVNTRSLAIMLLSGDEALEEKLSDKLSNVSLDECHRIRDNIQKQFSNPLSYVINIKRANYVNALVERACITVSKEGKTHPFIRGVLFYFLVPLADFFIGYKLATLSMSLISSRLQPESFMNFIIPIAVGGVTSIWFSLYLYLREYKERSTISEILGRITMHPIAEFPILI